MILGDVAKVQTGKLDVNAQDLNGQYPFFTCAQEPTRINAYSFDCECVLVAGNGDLNVKYYKGKFEAYQRTYVVEVAKKEVLDTRFLYYLLNNYLEKLRNLAIGGVIKYIKLGNLTDIVLLDVPLEEQRRIVEVLDRAENIRQKRTQSLKLLDDFLRATFSEMFVSREWGVGKLGEEIDVKSGQVDPRESIYAGMICVGGDNIESNTGRLLGLKTAKEVGAKSGKYLFDEGDILYSKIRPYLNKVVLTDFKGICSADIYPLKPKRKLTREFLTFILRSKDFLQYADKHSSRTSIPKINREALAEYKIILPPIDMQEQFSRTFQQVERLKTLLVKSASELDNQFNALMQRYFD